MTPTAMLKHLQKELAISQTHLAHAIRIIEIYLKITANDVIEKEPEEITHSSKHTAVTDERELSKSISYLEGWEMGHDDAMNAKIPIYLSNDDKGADSPEQAEYIRGYIAGYPMMTSHK